MPKRSWIVGLVVGWVALAVERVVLSGGPFRWSPPALREAIAMSVDERVMGLRRYARAWFMAFVDEILYASLFVGCGISVFMHAALLSACLCTVGDVIGQSTVVPVQREVERLHIMGSVPVARLFATESSPHASFAYKKSEMWSCAMTAFERFPRFYPKSRPRRQTQLTHVARPAQFSAETCLVAMGGMVLSAGTSDHTSLGQVVWYGPRRAVIELACIDITAHPALSVAEDWWNLIMDFAVLDRSEVALL